MSPCQDKTEGEPEAARAGPLPRTLRGQVTLVISRPRSAPPKPCAVCRGEQGGIYQDQVRRDL